jgi:hypothetical protein
MRFGIPLGGSGAVDFMDDCSLGVEASQSPR